MARNWKAWAGDVVTQAIGQAVGTLLAAGVVVLAGAAFGLIHGLGRSDVLTIVGVLVGAAGALAATAGWSREASEARNVEEQSRTLRESLEEIARIREEREREIREMERKERKEEERRSE
jgi:hypothetical protein